MEIGDRRREGVHSRQRGGRTGGRANARTDGRVGGRVGEGDPAHDVRDPARPTPTAAAQARAYFNSALSTRDTKAPQALRSRSRSRSLQLQLQRSRRRPQHGCFRRRFPAGWLFSGTLPPGRSTDAGFFATSRRARNRNLAMMWRLRRTRTLLGLWFRNRRPARSSASSAILAAIWQTLGALSQAVIR